MSENPEINFSNNYFLENFFLNEVYKYYPIGLNELKNYYQGYNELKEKIIDKLDFHLSNLNSESYLIEKDLKENFPSLRIENENYYQFPSYTFNIQIDEFENEKIKITENISIHISLITEHFTIYFNEITYNKIDNQKISYSVIQHYNSNSPEKIKLCEEIKKIVLLHFPNKSYIYHYSIKKMLISGGAPYGVDYQNNPDKRYSVFDFLFSNCNHDIDMIKILP